MAYPKESPIWAASGNTATCTAQGFFLQLLVGVTLYNASLAAYYLLKCCYEWTEEEVEKYEPLIHCVAIIFPVDTAIAGLPLKLYNSSMLWCYIDTHPPGCKESYVFGAEGNFAHGDNAAIYRWAFSFGPAWLCMMASLVGMILVYRTVLQREKEVDRLQPYGIAQRSRSRRVAWQAFWYNMAFYVSWGPGTIT